MNEIKKPTVALYPIEAQPPHFGLLLSITNALEYFDKVIVVVLDRELVMTTKQVMDMLHLTLKQFGDRVTLVSSTCDFTCCDMIPKGIPKFTSIITTDVTIYINMMTLGYTNVQVVGRLLGYHNIFIRKAYQQGCALDFLNRKINIGNMKTQR